MSASLSKELREKYNVRFRIDFNLGLAEKGFRELGKRATQATSNELGERQF